MKEYTLLKKNDTLLLFNKEKQVSLTDILARYPKNNVFAFEGDMGAGKTTLIKQLCEELGVQDIVNSPTFAIVNVYDIPQYPNNFLTDIQGKEIYHFDCYRLKNLQEAVDMGAEEYLYSNCYCFIEWPSMIKDLLPTDTVHVHISTIDESTRKLTIS